VNRLAPKFEESPETKPGKTIYDWLNGSLSITTTNSAHEVSGSRSDQLGLQVLTAVTVAVAASATKHELPETAAL
jgi:hypothetical protein